MATRSPYALSIAAAALVALVSAGRAGAAAPVELRPVGTFANPVDVAAPLHEDHLLFVVERAGRIRVVRDGTVLPTPFLDITSVVGQVGEGGLLSMAFTPRYWQTGRFVVVYTDRGGSIQISEYRRSATNPELADPLSARPILTIPHPGATNHYGGSSAFGPDGLLYVGTGDGGGAGDPNGNAQNLGSLLGKLLRIDPLGGDPYAIPPGNPFTATPGARPEIFAYGLRNPWRFGFDRSTGDLVIGDVGQNLYEEVDYVRAPVRGGLNFGWNVYEASHVFGPGSAPGAVFPVLEYQHTSTLCSITGGVVVRDPALGDVAGRYLYGDWCGGEIRSLALALPLVTDDVDTGLNVPQLVSFGEDAGGCVYAVSLQGTVYRLALAGAAAPVPCADVPPETTIASAPGSSTFAFSSSEAGSTFECRMDGGAFEACTSPRAYTLSPGTHLFETRATDPGGTVDPTPAQASVTVPAPAPEPPPAVAPVVPTRPSADLAVSLGAAPQPASVGKALTFVATVTNKGPDAATPTVTFTLPGGPKVVPVGTLAPGAVAEARVSVTARSAGTLVCSAAVSSDSDPSLGDNQATLTLRVAAAVVVGKVVRGTDRANVLVGTAGDDVLRGLGGNDRLDGRAGRDRLYGGGGNDTLVGGGGADKIFGGPGRDVASVRSGGKDTVACGGGRDLVIADRTDAVARDCEIVRR